MNPTAKPAPSFWLPDPLLGARAQKSGFKQSPWDQAPSNKVATWRSDTVVPASQDEAAQVNPHEPEGTASAEPSTSGKPAPAASAEGQAPQSQTQGADHPTAQTPAAQAAGGGADAVLAVTPEHLEQQIRIARQQGYVQGLKDGMAKTLLELQADRQLEKDLILKVSQALEGLHQDAFRLYEPMRKLSLHIAEQLVRGELSISGLAVERLVKACLSELTLMDQTVVVSMHPQDLERVRPLLNESGASLKLLPDGQLLPGSVRVQSNDTVIEDLVQNRLDNLAHSLIFEADDWMRNESSLAGWRVESVEPAAEETPMSRAKFDVVDIEEKATEAPSDSADTGAAAESDGTAVVDADSVADAVEDASEDQKEDAGPDAGPAPSDEPPAQAV